jgi:hypothetical protein
MKSNLEEDNIQLTVQLLSFDNVGRFNQFFPQHHEYYIHNCQLEVENGLSLRSHDDGEVSIEIITENANEPIHRIFKKYNPGEKLIDILRSKPGHYFSIDSENKSTGEFNNFEDYLNYKPK